MKETRLRYLAQINPPPPARIHGDEVPFIPMEAIGQNGGIEIKESKPREDLDGSFTCFENGDVIVAKITPCFENGKGALVAGLPGGFGVGTTELHVLRPGPALDPVFLFYVTLSDQFRRLGAGAMSGAAGQKRVPADFIADYRLAAPAGKQQRAIADFLDRETAKIDGLIAKKEQILRLIEERKLSTQFRFVTGAYSPQPKRQSSDPRLPPYPQNWTVEKLGYLAKLVSGGTPSKENPAFWSGAIPWVSPKDMKVPYLSDSGDHITPEAVIAASLNLLPASTILIVVRGMILAHSLPVCLLLSPATINQDIKGLRFNSKCDPHFMLVWLEGMSHILHSLVAESAHGTRCLRTDLLKNVVVHLPRIEEQAEIVSALNRHLARLDEASRPITAAISLLREYRAALISAAVTGQLDIRKHEKLIEALT